MDKEKQIEAMARVIDDRLIEARCYLGSMNKGEGYWIAQKLVERYQPKIPEDAVVLTREEYDELLTAKNFDYGYHEGECNMTSYYENIILPQARKETAKEILGLLQGYYDIAIDTIVIDYDDFVKIANQYGLE